MIKAYALAGPFWLDLDAAVTLFHEHDDREMSLEYLTGFEGIHFPRRSSVGSFCRGDGLLRRYGPS